ncbi:tetratricopeptide repeat protein [Aquisphaera insulae]|uniref:tetratricopeptide repeat protein n=1 Tax=Aquisphaera insulae TaxID=2712864 RepID=UPI0013EB500F|nr:tetratricopeptide repeat protein [Aquisphaera insulae]
MNTHSDSRLAEAIGLVDHALASSNSHASDSSVAVSALHRAVDIFRRLGDRGRETDALGNLGLVLLTAGRPTEAIIVLRATLQLAESTGDRYAQKIVLERLALAHLKLADPAGASRFLDEALDSARTLGDRVHESRLRWTHALALAELGRADLAVQAAEESVSLLMALGHPEAAWYEEQLRRYREEEQAASLGSASFVNAQVRSPQPAPSSKSRLLRMAMSATKAMMAFVGSGMKTIQPEVRAVRLALCGLCEHHTGQRCRICGCFTRAKSLMAHEQCPLGKWPVHPAEAAPDSGGARTLTSVPAG